MISEREFNNVKMLYEENATQHRFFLGWRQLMFAGFFAILAALALGFKWCIADVHAYVWVCPFTGVCVSFFFWALDYRNRELYRLSGEVGKILEEKLGYDGKGQYSMYWEHGRKSKFRHGVVLSAFYITSGSLMLLVLIASFIVDLTVNPGH